ncbi:MAG: hypothetical protein Q8M24_04930 [Pseudolabrys sp.]|nr:hypothetical protein [Pseudolabrys sp.]MDP2294789.1 hypothetical protein [Pseudolabrys sp.]
MSAKCIAAAFATMVVVSLATPAVSQSRHDATSTDRISKHQKRTAPQPYAAPRIVCTKAGCRPIPARCGITMEQTWDGPTGTENVHCW